MKILLADFNAGYLLCTKSTVQPKPIVIFMLSHAIKSPSLKAVQPEA